MKVPSSDDLVRQTTGLLAFTRALCAQDSDAADLSQNALVAALERPEVRRSSLAGWLRGTSRLLERRRYRQAAARDRRELVAARPEGVPSAAERAEHLETQRRVLGLVTALPADQAEALYLRFWEDQSPRAIAATLGVPVETVKSRLKRGLLELRRRMDAETEGGRERWLSALGAGTTFAPSKAGASAAVALFSGKVILGGLVAAALIGLGLDGAWRSSPPAATGESLIPLVTDDDTTSLEVATGLMGSSDSSGGPGRSGIVATDLQETGASSPPPERRVTGIVHDVMGHGSGAQERPAAHVKVTLSGGMIDANPLSALTDENGCFAIVMDEEHGAMTSVQVFASGDDRFRSAHGEVTFADNDAREETIDLRRHLFSSLTGTLVTSDRDGSGRFLPFEGALLRARRGRGEGRRNAEPWLTKTDRLGRFTFPGAPADVAISMDSPDWICVTRAERVQQSREGLWPEVPLLAVPVTDMEVLVTDYDGAPLEGARVRVVRAECERGRLLGPGDSWEFRPLSGKTDAEGRFKIPRVWCHQRLEVVAVHGKFSATTEREGMQPERDSDGRSSETERLLVGRPGETLRCSVRMRETRRLSGRVIAAEGESAGGLGVWLRSFRRDDSFSRIVSLNASTDDDGRFEIEYPVESGAMGEGSLVVSSQKSMRRGMLDLDDSRLAHALVTLDRDVLGIELTPRAPATISGSVKAPDGRGLEADFELLPLDEPALRGLLPSGLPSRGRAKEDGSFMVRGVPAGRYDLRFDRVGYGSVTLSAVEAGASDLSVELTPGGEQATLKIEVVPPVGRSIAKMGLLELRLEESDVVDEGLRTLGPEEEVRATRSIPRFAGAVGGPFALESRRWIQPSGFRDRTVTGRFAELVGEPGPALICLRYIVDDEGRRLAPISTGPVIVRGGVTALRFHVRAAGVIEGKLRIPGGDAVGDAFVREPLLANVRFPSGEFLLVPNARVEVGALGTFRIQGVPEGECDVVVGSAREWRADTPRFTGRVTVVEGETTTVLMSAR